MNNFSLRPDAGTPAMLTSGRSRKPEEGTSKSRLCAMPHAQLDQYVAQVQGLSLDSKTYMQLTEYVRKSASSFLTSNLAQLDSVLEALESPQHSVGILGVLYVKLNNEAATDTLLALVQEFLLHFNVEQIRNILDIASELCHKYTSILVQRKDYFTGINVLCFVIKTLRTSQSQLLSIHADLFQLCLLAKNFKPALQFLDVDITDIAKENTSFDAKYFLLYYYYGGMIYAALKKFDRALYFFEVAITTPAQALSQIVIESNKKYILISLLLHGKLVPLPKYVSQVVSRSLKSCCAAYVELVSAYNAKSADKLQQVVAKHRDLLTRTFLTLSLADVAYRCHLSGAAEAEKYLITMIEDGEIYAEINKRDGMVNFRDNPEKFDTPDVSSMINKSLEIAFEVNEKVEKLDDNYFLNPQYVQKIMKQGNAASWTTEDEGLGTGTGNGGGGTPDVFPSIGGF
uniref:COP9 signalosome complex subunit 3 n=1 Tax=Romanomermis culicivorax TaxID=13658 RepID=A0A915IG28_ROMCU